jgi:hypothetical protein
MVVGGRLRDAIEPVGDEQCVGPGQQGVQPRNAIGDRFDLDAAQRPRGTVPLGERLGEQFFAQGARSPSQAARRAAL